MKIRRRDFLKVAGATGVGTMVFNPAVSAFGKTNAGPDLAPGQWKSTTCQGCTTWCPIQMYVQDGRVTKVRGNPNSKLNDGFCCPRGHMLPKIIYDPDRLKVPMKRTNPVKGKGIDPGFVPITWDEAIDTVATKMMELRNANETHKYAYIRGRYTGMTDILYDRFTKIFGSPNNISHSAICAEAEKAGPMFTEGYWGYRQYDLDNTKCLVLWGVDPTRSNRIVPGSIKRFGNVLDYAKVINIDPVLTNAGTKAHEWLPIIPGEDGALATALAHVILTTGKWSKEFVGDFNDKVNRFKAGQMVNEADFTETYTSGVVKWWNIELNDKTPEWAAKLTGISAEKIIQVANMMGDAGSQTAVWLGPGPVMTPRGTYTAMAIHALNGLLGSADNVGGTHRTNSTSTSSPAATTNYEDAIAKAGKAMKKIDQRGTLTFPAMASGTPGSGVVTNNMANALLAKDPYDIKVLLSSWANFSYSTQQPDRWNEALSKIPFFVHLTTHASEMSMFADIVLPVAHEQSEAWGYVKSAGFLYSNVSIQQPITKSIFERYGTETEIPFLIAKKLADKGFTKLYEYFTTEFKDVDTGVAPATSGEFAVNVVKKATKTAYDKIGGWEKFLEVGTIETGPYTFKSKWNAFGTATKKFEFYSQTIKNSLTTHAGKFADTSVDMVLEACNYTARGEKAFVPHYEPPKRWGSKEEYPFTFMDVKSRLNREGRSQNQPWYYSFQKVDAFGLESEDSIKMNPTDATALGLKNGDNVKVSSPTGSMITKVKVWEGLRPGTVCKTFGFGHWAYGKTAAKDFGKMQPRGGNNNDILPDDYDRLSGSSARNGGYAGVKIEKI